MAFHPHDSNRLSALQDVLRNPAIWQARRLAREQEQGEAVPSAWPLLDQALPQGGWPPGVLTELLVAAAGTGELSLLLPALRSVAAQGRGIALLAPPWLPHARAWESAGLTLGRLLVVDAHGNDLLWSAEQALRSGECGAVLLWGQAAGRALDHRALQRLHVAAGTGKALCFLYRSFGAEANPSPAPLRLKLAAQAGTLQVKLLKCRGSVRARPVPLRPFPAHWNAPGDWPLQPSIRVQTRGA